MDGQPSLGRAACLLSTEDTFTTGVHKINNCTFSSHGPWHKGPGGPIKGASLQMPSVLPLGPGLPWTRGNKSLGLQAPGTLGKMGGILRPQNLGSLLPCAMSTGYKRRCIRHNWLGPEWSLWFSFSLEVAHAERGRPGPRLPTGRNSEGQSLPVGRSPAV